MKEPLPGQKTNIVALVFTVVQALASAGFIPDEIVEPASQIAAGLFSLTLALKAWRKSRGGR